MKKIFFFAFLLLTQFVGYAQISMMEADIMLKDEDRYKECILALEKTVPTLQSQSEKAEALWRLSCACMLAGELETDRTAKAELFKKGIGYGNDAVKADPKNHKGYMWHCANIGRECQMKGLKDQMAALPKMTSDLETILDKLGATDCFEAWQALSEIYFNHPFKSNDSAINFSRKSLDCLKSDQLPLYLFVSFAEMLYKRNWSASKRSSDYDKRQEKFGKTYYTNIDKYEYFEGSLGKSYVPLWSTVSLGQMSDREEAIALVNYAIKRYENFPNKTKANDKILVNIKKYIEKNSR